MASGYTAEFRDRNNQYQITPAGLEYRLANCSWRAVGGADQAEISVIGGRDSVMATFALLGNSILIRNPDGTAIWWGHVHEIECSLGGIVFNQTLEDVFNRINVIYVTRAADGSAIDGKTGWGDDPTSQAKYGIREKTESFEGTLAAAERLRDKMVNELRNPVFQWRTEDSDVGATLFCLGAWHRLGWQYYEQPAGLLEYDEAGPGEQPLGASYQSAQIRYAAQDDIFDGAGLAAAGFAALDVGDVFYMYGATNAANRSDDAADKFTVKSRELAGTEGHIETVDKDRVDAAVGPNITLTRAGTRVDRIAQSITLAVDTDDWTVATIAIRASAIGGPPDSLRVELCADSGGNPGTVLDGAQIAGSALTENLNWVEFALSNTVELSYGTTYWILVRRTGSNSLDNYYVIDVNEDASYAGGQCKTWNGSAWAVRSPAADMQFRLTGKTETTVQLQKMIAANAEFGADGVVIQDASGIFEWQYRTGDALAIDEIMALIEQGTAAGERLLVDVLYAEPGELERVAVIYKQPAASTSDKRLNNDGTVGAVVGDRGRVEQGVDVAGEWLTIYSPALTDMLATRAVFVETAEYDGAADRYHLDGAINKRIWKLTRITGR